MITRKMMDDIPPAPAAPVPANRLFIFRKWAVEHSFDLAVLTYPLANIIAIPALFVDFV